MLKILQRILVFFLSDLPIDKISNPHMSHIFLPFSEVVGLMPRESTLGLLEHSLSVIHVHLRFNSEVRNDVWILLNVSWRIDLSVRGRVRNGPANVVIEHLHEQFRGVDMIHDLLEGLRLEDLSLFDFVEVDHDDGLLQLGVEFPVVHWC